MKKIWNQIRFLRVTSTTQRFLRLAMGMISGVALLILDAFLNARVSDPIAARHHIPAWSEYLIVSVLISVIGAVLIERVQGESKE